jgi:hypothetical protein
LQGISYFAGWNLTDFAQFWVFGALYYSAVIDVKDKEYFMP